MFGFVETMEALLVVLMQGGARVGADMAPQNREEVLEGHSGTGKGRSLGV